MSDTTTMSPETGEGTQDVPAAAETDAQDTTDTQDDGAAEKPEGESGDDDSALTGAGKEEAGPAKKGGRKPTSEKQDASAAPETTQGEAPADPIAAFAANAVKKALNEVADEFQSWAAKGETPDGSRADMAVVPRIVAALRERASKA